MVASSKHLPLGYMLVAAIFSVVLVFHPIYDLYFAVAACIWLLTWRRPSTMLALIFIAAPLQQNLMGSSANQGDSGTIAIAPPELLFAVSLPAFIVIAMLQRQSLKAGPPMLPIAFYLGCCLLSSLFNWHNSALISLVQMFVYLVLVMVTFTSFVERTKDLLLALNMTVLTGLVLTVIILTGTATTLHLTKNGIGSSLGACLLVCAELWFAEPNVQRKRLKLLAMGILTLGLLFSLSRGSWLGAAGGLIVISVLRREFRPLMHLGILVAILFPIFWLLIPQESRDYTTNFDSKNANVYMRSEAIETGQAFFAQNPIIGVGVGLRKEFDATNVFWFTLAETGVIGLVAFTLIHLSFYRMLWKVQKTISHSDPIFSMVTIGGALIMSKLLHGMVDHYWSRGELLMTWAAAGMATRVYVITFPKAVKSPFTTPQMWPVKTRHLGADSGPPTVAPPLQNSGWK